MSNMTTESPKNLPNVALFTMKSEITWFEAQGMGEVTLSHDDKLKYRILYEADPLTP